jgi:4-amino-4-deoxy-L-arabinose transferase-like glycosyltransferase
MAEARLISKIKDAVSFKGLLISLPFLILIVIQGLTYFNIPMIPEENDSAWYYMNVHFMQTGEYIYESAYPSFTGASQVYPLGGYSLIILLAKTLGDTIGVYWIYILKIVQFLAYLSTGLLVFLIGDELKYRRSAIAATLLYFLYFPFFHFANYVMSETMAIFLVALCCWTLLRGLLKENNKYIYCSMFINGFAILFKPVLLLYGILSLLIIYLSKRDMKNVAISLLLFIMIPFIQSVSNKAVFGNYQLRTGIGWNLYHRIIHFDHSIPKNSKTLNALAEKYPEMKFDVTPYYWWNIAMLLSRAEGLSEKETQEICKEIALDGLKENKSKYITNTFSLAYDLFTKVPKLLHIFIYYGDFYQFLRDFGDQDRQHKPLIAELIKQEGHLGYGSAGDPGFSLNFNTFFAKTFYTFGWSWFHFLKSSGYLIYGIFIFIKLKKDLSKANLVLAFTYLIPLLVIVSSVAASGTEPRYKYPVMPLMFLVFCFTIEELIISIKKFADRGKISES